MKTFDIMEENRKRGVVPPKGRRILPVFKSNEKERVMDDKITEYLKSLGYDLDCLGTPSYKNKYYDEKKYEDTVNEIIRLFITEQEIPKEYVDYMLEVKKIKEKYNLE
jgi:hypothetical protein